jgi:hypothetical protein
VVFKREILRVNVLAGTNVHFSHADVLPIAPQMLAFGDGDQGHLVTHGDVIDDRDLHAADDELLTGSQRNSRHDDVVDGVQVDGRIFSRREFSNVKEAHGAKAIFIVRLLSAIGTSPAASSGPRPVIFAAEGFLREGSTDSRQVSFISCFCRQPM